MRKSFGIVIEVMIGRRTIGYFSATAGLNCFHRICHACT